MESMSRLGSLLESARDLTLEAAKDVAPRKSTRSIPEQQIKKLLDSRNERDVLDGLRKVVSMQYAHPPQSQATLKLFPAVLKTLSNQSASTRPLVYNYLVHHAEADPDTALLAINTIQKSLSDTNPRVRAMALKTMAGIRVPVISQIVSLAIKKGTSDLSPIVRKTAALACVKCVRLDENTRPQIEEHIATLLGDQQYYVAGAAVQAFLQICPERLDLIHPAYRKLCKMIVDMDEWGQIATLRLMTTYGRKCFPQRTHKVKRTATQEEKTRSFYEEHVESDQNDSVEIDHIEPDLELLLQSVQPLLQSRNAAVIVAVTRLYLYLSPGTYLSRTVGPLIALLRSPQDIKEVALFNIAQVCVNIPSEFAPHLRHFLVKAIDTNKIRVLKLELLTLIFTALSNENQDLVLAELEHFSLSNDETLVRDSVRAIGRCAQSSDARTSQKCLTLLLKQIHSPDAHLVGEAVEVVRHMIQRDPDAHRKTVIRLAKNLDLLTSPAARAGIIWLVGEYSSDDTNSSIAPDMLRILIKGYAKEKDVVREQIVLMATKVYLRHIVSRNNKTKAIGELKSDEKPAEEDESQDHIHRLFQHVLLLARYTSSYDLRDRARMYRSLLLSASNTDLASLLLLAPKPIPQALSSSELRKNLSLGSASLVLADELGGMVLKSYEDIPDWVKDGQEPDPQLRSTTEIKSDASTRQKLTASQRLDEALETDPGYRTDDIARKPKTLDAWLDEEDGEEQEESEEEDEEGSEEEDDSSEYETDSESEETESENDEKAELVR